MKRRTQILGVVVGDLVNPFFAEMAKLIERHAASRGYTAMFCNTEGDSQSELEGVGSLLAHRVAGIVFLAFSGESRTMREALEHQVPVIFVVCSGEWGDVVLVDDVHRTTLPRSICRSLPIVTTWAFRAIFRSSASTISQCPVWPESR